MKSMRAKMVFLVVAGLLPGCLQTVKVGPEEKRPSEGCGERAAGYTGQPVSFSISLKRGDIRQDFVVTAGEQRFRNRVLCSGLFRDVYIGKTSQGYYIEYNIFNDIFVAPYHGGFAVLSLMTLGLVPGYDEESYRVQANLYYDGKFLGQYTGTRTMQVYYWFPFAFVAPQQTSWARMEIMDMLLSDVNGKLRERDWKVLPDATSHN